MSGKTNWEAVFAVGGLVAWGVIGGLYFAFSSSASPTPAATAQAVPPVAADAAAAAPSNVEFRNYMRALAPDVMPAVNATEAISECVEGEETAPASASAALSCLRADLERRRAANARLREVHPPADQRAHHASLLVISDAAIRGLDEYVAAFDSAAPRLDRLRRRQRLQVFYTNSDRDEVTDLQGRVRPMEAAFSRWATLIGQLNVECNDRLRCMSAGGRAVGGRPPLGYEPREPWQNNCPCPRVWNSLRGEGHEAILTAEESGLPPFRGGIL